MSQQHVLSLSNDVTFGMVLGCGSSLEGRGHKPLGHQGSLFQLLMKQSHLGKMFCWSQNPFQKHARGIYFDKFFSVKVLIENEHSGDKVLHQKVDLFNMKQIFWHFSVLQQHLNGFVFMPKQNKTNLELENCQEPKSLFSSKLYLLPLTKAT